MKGSIPLNRRRLVRTAMIVGFILFLVDGGAAVWLGQLSGRTGLVVVGVMLLVVAAGVVIAYFRWIRLLDEVAVARRALREDLEGLRRSASDAQSRWRN
ncbi:MAG TPA: hypothetical protein VGI92_05710 [Gemmatimonadales bacterium]